MKDDGEGYKITLLNGISVNMEKERGVRIV